MTSASDRPEDAGAVLSQDAPPVGVEEAAVLLRRLYGVEGAIEPLPSERDHNFRVRTGGGKDFVLKIAHPGEARAVTEFQTQALRHIADVDPGLPVPRVVPSLDGRFDSELAPGGGPRRIVRLLTYLPGRLLIQAPRSGRQDRALGTFLARLGRAMRGFIHPAAAQSDLLWDIRQMPRCRTLLPAIADLHRRALVERTIDEAEAHALPILPGLRAQVVHNDLNPSNVVVAEADPDRVAGVLDFGDMLHGPLVCDIAVGAAYRWSEGEHPLAGAARFVAGYDTVTRLEDAEIDVLYDLIRGRLALTLAIVDWQAARYPHKRAYVLRLNAELWRFLESLSGLSRDEAQAFFRAAIRGDTSPMPTAARGRTEEPIQARRRRLLGPTYSLFYDEPVHPVRGEGIWLHAADGTRYLDCYNNVVSVGHCHPHVVAALSRQAACLNTHTRYLDDMVLDLAERLVATMPDHLGHALFTCTGSEANDLALRIAEHATGGRGAIVTAFAYHGNTVATAALSPAAGGPNVLGDRNVAIPAPDTFRDGGAAAARFLDNLRAAIARLREGGRRPAALILDASFSSDGIFFPAPEMLAEAGAIIRSAGGLMIADEVQAGFGRLGRSMWGFEHYGYAPDIVTMGKPMGDGHPVAGLMIRPALVEGFGAKEGYFNTFGGNPVAAAVAIAVLEVIDREGLIANAGQVGGYLRQRLDGLRGRHAAIADVRGMGLYCGVEIAGAPAEARRRAAAIVNGLRRRHVLIGACAPDGNVLKIRPPLPFSTEHADLLVEALDAVLLQTEAAAAC